MTRSKLAICMMISLVMALPVAAQDTLLPVKVLSEEDFFSIIKRYHPVAQQATIIMRKADAGLLMSRGGFDPSVYLNSNQKTFDGKQYYRYTNPELKIPTWYGIEVKAGTENNNGLFTNSELTTGQSSYIGISVPLAKNLLMDKRRAALKKAKIMVRQSEAEQQQVVNDLMFEAGSAYWKWAQAYQVNSILQDVITVNRERFNLVKIGFRQGDRPALDTTEALAQLQQFEYLYAESSVALRVSELELSNYLWLDGNRYYELDSTIVPDKTWQLLNISSDALPVLPDLLSVASRSHPELKQYEQKILGLTVEKKLAFQELLPVVNVSANLLNRGYDIFNKIGGNFYENNNKFGISLGLPLRLSEGRGGYKLAKLRLQETNLTLNIKRQSVLNKVSAYFNELAGLQKQVSIYTEAYLNYEKLARGENLRFRSGEGSLFLVNARENKLLEANQKLIELKTKYFKTKLAVQWATGNLL